MEFNRKAMKKTTAALAASVIGISLLLTGCGLGTDKTAESEEEIVVAVNTQAAETGTITLSNSFVGTISPEETVMVIPMAAGTVTETFFEVGDAVNAGDVLFKIDDEAARLQLEQAQLSLQSTKQQADSALTTQQDSANLQLEGSKIQAESGYKQAQIQYVSTKDAYKKMEDACDKAEKNLNGLQAQLAAKEAEKAMLKAQIDAGTSAGTVTGNDLTDLMSEYDAAVQSAASLTSDIAAAYTNISNFKSQRDTMYNSYLAAKTAYEAAEKSKNLTDDTSALTKGPVLEDTKEQLATGLSLAELGVESAEMMLSHYTVTAPVSGVIESKNVDVNSIAAQGSPAYTIVNNNTMTVTFQVSEAVKNTLSIGQEITLDRSGEIYSAAITEIGNSVNMQTGLFQIKGCVQATGKELPSGVSVKISADTYQAQDVILIPYDAVYYENEGAYTYLSVNGVAVKTPITPGIFDDENIEVISGVKAGDIIVTSWSPQLTDGVKLKAATSGTSGNSDSE